MALVNILFRLLKRERPQQSSVVKIIPDIELLTVQTPSEPKTFLYPAPNLYSRIRVDGKPVGSVDYGLNPLEDRVYIHKIDIAPEYQRRGYALAALALIAAEHKIPIIPVHIWGFAIGFWSKARSHLQALGFEIGPEIRCSQLNEEAARWQHLRFVRKVVTHTA